MKKLLAPLSLVIALLGVSVAGFLTAAHAASSMTPEDGDLLALVRPIFDQIMAGHYVASAALSLVLVVALVKRYAPGRVGGFVHSDMGGALSTLLMSFGGALATATIGGAPWSWAICWTALGIGVTAMGGYTAIKKLFVEPLLRPLLAKAPPWARPLFALVMWIFDKPTAAGAKADAAGTLAVAQHPGTGSESIVGQPKDL